MHLQKKSYAAGNPTLYIHHAVPAPMTVIPRCSYGMLVLPGSVGDVRGRWPAIFDIHVTKYTLELTGSTNLAVTAST